VGDARPPHVDEQRRGVGRRQVSRDACRGQGGAPGRPSRLVALLNPLPPPTHARHVLLYVSEGCQPKNRRALLGGGEAARRRRLGGAMGWPVLGPTPAGTPQASPVTDTLPHPTCTLAPYAPRLFHLDLSAVPKDPKSGALDFSRFDFFSGPEKLPVSKLVDDFEAAYDYVGGPSARGRGARRPLIDDGRCAPTLYLGCCTPLFTFSFKTRTHMHATHTHTHTHTHTLTNMHTHAHAHPRHRWPTRATRSTSRQTSTRPATGAGGVGPRRCQGAEI
jgi:hypothetical protein